MAEFRAGLQWAMIGLVTGGEVYGALPPAATGRLSEFLNGDTEGVLAVTRASTMETDNGTELPDLLVAFRHITYVQPWGSSTGVDATPAALQVPRNYQQVDLGLILRTRIAIGGTGYIPPDMRLESYIGRETERFIQFGASTISTPAGETRQADTLHVNKDHIMLARHL